MLDGISWEELQMWAAFASIEPFGAQRDDLLSAYSIATFVNMHRDPNSTAKPMGDFMLLDKLRSSVEDQKKIEEFDEDEGAPVDPGLLTWLTAVAAPEGTA